MTSTDSTTLWSLIIAHQHETFRTSGRGSRPGVEFTYHVKPSAGPSGQHYNGEDIPGWSNEMMIDRKAKTITRATVELAYEKVVNVANEQGTDVPVVTGRRSSAYLAQVIFILYFRNMG